MDNNSSEYVSTWENPTEHVVTFSIRGGGKKPRVYTVPPKGSVQVDRVYDQAIRTLRDGVVVAGLAPQLVKKGEAEVPVHVSLAEAAAAGDKERASKALSRMAGKPMEEVMKAMKGIAEGSPGAKLAMAEAELAAQEEQLLALQKRKAERDAKIAQMKADLEAPVGGELGGALDAAGIGTSTGRPRSKPAGG